MNFFTMNLLKRCTFATIPNAFEQCTTPLLIIHSALFKGLKENLPDPWFINNRFRHKIKGQKEID